MPLELPKNFKEHIQHRDTQIFPVVVIGTHSQDSVTDESLTNYFNSAIHISTGTTSYNLGSLISDSPTVYTKPKLLNISSIKESIDMEKRNYKISSVNIEISNLEYQGSTFNDDIVASGMESLINKEVRIYWHSPTSNFIFPFDLDYSITDQDVLDRRALMVYYGKVARFDQDDKSSRLVIEDISQEVFYKDLPLEYLPTTNEIPDAYKGKPIPMVFGNVEKSPAVAIDNHNSIIADSKEFQINTHTKDLWQNNESPVWIDVETNYLNVLNTSEIDDSKQLVYDYSTENPSVSKIGLHFNPKVPNVDTSVVSPNPMNIYCNDYSAQYKVTLSNMTDSVTADMDNPEGSLGKISDGQLKDNFIDWMGSRDTYSSGFTHLSDIILFYDNDNGQLAIDFRSLYNITHPTAGEYAHPAELLLLKLNFDFRPTYDILGTPRIKKCIINNQDVSLLLKDGSNSSSNYYAGTYARAIISENIEGNPDLFDSIGQTSNWYSGITAFKDSANFEDLKNVFNFSRLTSIDYENTNSAIQFKSHENLDQNENELTVTSVFTSGDYKSNFKQISFLRTFPLIDELNRKFYINTNGRKIYSSNGGMVFSGQPQYDEIMKTLVGELSDPDKVQLTGLYNNWKYAFCIDKKTNSKKVIEDMSSASPFIARFTNLGKFDYSAIEQTYTDNWLDKDGNPAFTINKNDVLSISYSRTKIEDVYQKVIFKYKWDYRIKEYLGVVESLDVNSFPSITSNYDMNYYGGEKVLTIDDDRGKYIRQQSTAQDFANWMLLYHCNPHLKLKLSLPLSYLHLEVGDIVNFSKVVGTINPYNINYGLNDKNENLTVYTQLSADGATIAYRGQELNGQQLYPEFMINSINKKMNSVDIECIQMHNLSFDPTVQGIYGCTNSNAWNYNESATIDNGSCIIAPTDPNTPLSDTKNFTQFMSNDCPELMQEIGNITYYANNYPSPDTVNSMQNADWGDGIADGSEDREAGRFYYGQYMDEAKDYYKNVGTPTVYHLNRCDFNFIENAKLMRVNIMNNFSNINNTTVAEYHWYTPQAGSTRPHYQQQYQNHFTGYEFYYKQFDVGLFNEVKFDGGLRNDIFLYFEDMPSHEPLTIEVRLNTTYKIQHIPLIASAEESTITTLSTGLTPEQSKITQTGTIIELGNQLKTFSLDGINSGVFYLPSFLPLDWSDYSYEENLYRYLYTFRYDFRVVNSLVVEEGQQFEEMGWTGMAVRYGFHPFSQLNNEFGGVWTDPNSWQF